MGTTKASRAIAAFGLAGLLAVVGAAARQAAGQPVPGGQRAEGDEGKRVFKELCSGCHKWHGGGGGGYGGAALSLRQTELTREQLVEVVNCGRPGTGMPAFRRDAYADGSCYGLKKADLGKDAPPEANHFLRPREAEAVADYVLANVKGKGEPGLADCQAYWGEQSRVCEEYRRGQAGNAPRSGG